MGSGCYAVSRKREDGNVATTAAPTTTVAPTSTSVELARYSTITATDVTFTCDANQADCDAAKCNAQQMALERVRVQCKTNAQGQCITDTCDDDKIEVIDESGSVTSGIKPGCGFYVSNFGKITIEAQTSNSGAPYTSGWGSSIGYPSLSLESDCTAQETYSSTATSAVFTYTCVTPCGASGYFGWSTPDCASV